MRLLPDRYYLLRNDKDELIVQLYGAHGCDISNRERHLISVIVLFDIKRNLECHNYLETESHHFVRELRYEDVNQIIVQTRLRHESMKNNCKASSKSIRMAQSELQEIEHIKREKRPKINSDDILNMHLLLEIHNKKISESLEKRDII